nr:hypothetical protein [Tanacetum cinerariifolium]
ARRLPLVFAAAGAARQRGGRPAQPRPGRHPAQRLSDREPDFAGAHPGVVLQAGLRKPGAG